MSCTEIYAMTPNSCEWLGDTDNAWRGAMYVWNHISREYFGLASFPMFDEGMMSKVWNANHYHDMPEHESIVLLSTLDRFTVKAQDLPKLIAAFEQYGKEHPLSSIRDQAAILKDAELSSGEIVVWNQSSVGEFHFSPKHTEDANGEEIITYHDLSDVKDLFELLPKRMGVK